MSFTGASLSVRVEVTGEGDSAEWHLRVTCTAGTTEPLSAGLRMDYTVTSTATEHITFHPRHVRRFASASPAGVA